VQKKDVSLSSPEHEGDTVNQSEKRKGMLLVCVAMVTLQGCAIKVFERFRLEDGTSVSIDAKQRVVLTSSREGREGRQTIACAEPSPDALAALSASASGAFGNNSDKLIQAAFGSSESAAAIGLRTQTIQLLRDGMYRICEGYLSGGIDKAGFFALQRRYQNLMMGLLAIEQLTGAVKAGQATIGGAAAAGVGSADLTKEQERLKTTRQEEVDAQKSVTDAERAYEEQRKKISSLEANLKQAQADQAKSPSQANLDKIGQLEDELVGERRVLGERQSERDRSRGLLLVAKENTKLAQQSLNLAHARLTAQATSVGSLVAGTGYQGLDPRTTKEIATTVKEVVSEVILKSFVFDACLASVQSGPPLLQSVEVGGVADASPFRQAQDMAVEARYRANRAAADAYEVFTRNCQSVFAEISTRLLKSQAP
jgi:hypothetical protein